MKYLYKILKYLSVVVLTLLGVYAVKNYMSDPERIEKKKAKAKEKLLKKVNASDKKRKKIRDKYSHIIRILLIIVLTANVIHAKYIVYDKEEKVWRDYGSITNYVKSLEEEKKELINNRSNIIYTSTNIINEIAEECSPSIWERFDFYVGLAAPTILLFLLLL